MVPWMPTWLGKLVGQFVSVVSQLPAVAVPCLWLASSTVSSHGQRLTERGKQTAAYLSRGNEGLAAEDGADVASVLTAQFLLCQRVQVPVATSAVLARRQPHPSTS